MDPVIVLFGLGVGVLVGLTGMGGGSLMTPLLIIVFGVKPVTAVGTDLSYAAVTKTVGGLKHWRQRTVDARLSTWMALGSVPAAVGGVAVLKALQHAYGSSFDHVMLVMLAAALLFTGVAVLARALLLPQLASSERESARLERRDKVAAVAIGVFVGFVLGITSAGSGALIAVALILVFRLVPTRVVGTDVFHAAILLWAAAAAHVVAGNVDFALAGTILIGSVPGVWIGSHVSVRVPAATLRSALAVVLLGSGLGLFSKAGASVPPPAPALAHIAAAPRPSGQAYMYRIRTPATIADK
ncbi:MAG: sulfite exporter TauE/SafE family protein [Thermoleophilaceae bacterium]